jgi:hypothetical protein
MNLHLNDLDVLIIDNKTVVINGTNKYVDNLEQQKNIKLILVDNDTYLIQILNKDAFQDIKLNSFITEIEELL